MVVLDSNNPEFFDESLVTTSEQYMKLDPTKSITVIGFPQNYAWGKVGTESLVAQLLPNIDPAKPYAELWFGCHPSGPSMAHQGESSLPLHSIVSNDPGSFLGTAVHEKFGPALPFLFKILSVGGALSIQLHPTKDQAERLHREKPDLYKDSNHKPEIAIAVTPVNLLYGFRSYQVLKQTVSGLTCFTDLMPADAIRRFTSAESKSDQEAAFKSLYGSLMRLSLSEAGKESIKRETDRLVRNFRALNSPDEAQALVLQLNDSYPGDVGLFAPLLMNIVTLHPGQALYTEPCVPHAYLSGNMVEVMANSDNVVRAGLTPKKCDVETLIDIVNCRMGAAPIIESVPVSGTPFMKFPTPAAEFEVQVGSGKFESKIDTRSKPELLFSLDGEGSLCVNGVSSKLVRGQAVLLSAGITSYNLEVTSGSVYRVVLPDVDHNRLR